MRSVGRQTTMTLNGAFPIPSREVIPEVAVNAESSSRPHVGLSLTPAPW